MKTLKFISHLNPDDCIARLREHQTSLTDSLLSFPDAGSVHAVVTPPTFRLVADRPLGVRNSFALHFHGRLRPDARGTVITGRFLPHAFARLFLFFFCLPLVLVFVENAMCFLGGTGPNWRGIGNAIVFFSLAFLVIGGAMLSSAKYFPHTQGFIETILEAKEITKSEPGL